jgi:DNA-binding NtrC family response regulator
MSVALPERQIATVAAAAPTSFVKVFSSNSESSVLPLGDIAPQRGTQPNPDSAAICAQPPGAAAAPPNGAIQVTDATGHLKPLEEIEGQMIRLAIERYEGHMSEVARRLGIGRSTLYRKVRDLGLEVRGEAE